MLDHEFLRHPYPVYRRLVEGEAMQLAPLFNGSWICGHYSECIDLLRDPRLSSAGADSFIHTLPPEDRAQFEPFGELFRRWLVFQNGATHRQIRKLLYPSFAPDAVEELHARIRVVTDLLIDSIARQQGGDVIRDLAYPLPTMVIGELLGVPEEHREWLIRWTQGIADLIGAPQATIELAQRAQSAILDATALFQGLITERRKNPADDLLSRMLRPDEEGAVIDGEELAIQCVVLMLAGHETTRNLIGNAVYLLLQHGGAWRSLRDDPELLRSAVEEVLRYESPTRFVGRVFLEDGEFAGVSVKAGQLVVTMLGAANRDPRQYPNADEFDVARKNNAHLAFGAGAHSCLGANLARLEGRSAIGALVERFPNLTLYREPEWAPSAIFRGLQSLPVSVPLAASRP
ncbi:MAG TPA: cytochrome P450 [Bryobacteraceae bacterium]|nr:cytochrome P450 [Bryobacteraceae bacterium]